MILLTATQTALASSIEKKCGDTIFQITIENSDDVSNKFNFFYKINSKDKKLFYSPAADSISVACIQNKAKQDLLLIEEFCSGSVCSDDGVYTVFDPTNKKMLIKFSSPSFNNCDEVDDLGRCISDTLREHEQKNHVQVKKLIGYKPPYLPNNKDTFCCSKSQE